MSREGMFDDSGFRGFEFGDCETCIHSKRGYSERIGEYIRCYMPNVTTLGCNYEAKEEKED